MAKSGPGGNQGTGSNQQTGSNQPPSTQSLIDSLQDINKPLPSSRRPTTININNPGNPFIPVPGQKFRPSSSNRQDEHGLIKPAPRPRIRREENSPDRSYESLLAERNRKLAPPNKKQRVESDNSAQASTTRTTYTRPKAGKKIPETFVQAEPWDKMLWTRRLEGKGWMEICDEWEKMTKEGGDGTDDKLRRKKRRELADALSARFIKLKEAFAASGTLDLPDEHYAAHPEDLKYKIISNRRKQDVKMIDIMEKSKAQLDDLLWETFRQNYQEQEGEEISVDEARERYEALTNGVARRKVASDKTKVDEAEEGGEGAQENEEDPDPDSLFVPE